MTKNTKKEPTKRGQVIMKYKNLTTVAVLAIILEAVLIGESAG